MTLKIRTIVPKNSRFKIRQIWTRIDTSFKMRKRFFEKKVLKRG